MGHASGEPTYGSTVFHNKFNQFGQKKVNVPERQPFTAANSNIFKKSPHVQQTQTHTQEPSGSNITHVTANTGETQTTTQPTPNRAKPITTTSSIHFEHISSSLQNQTNHNATQTTQNIYPPEVDSMVFTVGQNSETQTTLPNQQTHITQNLTSTDTQQSQNHSNIQHTSNQNPFQKLSEVDQDRQSHQMSHHSPSNSNITNQTNQTNNQLSGRASTPTGRSSALMRSTTELTSASSDVESSAKKVNNAALPPMPGQIVQNVKEVYAKSGRVPSADGLIELPMSKREFHSRRSSPTPTRKSTNNLSSHNNTESKEPLNLQSDSRHSHHSQSVDNLLRDADKDTDRDIDNSNLQLGSSLKKLDEQAANFINDSLQKIINENKLKINSNLNLVNSPLPDNSEFYQNDIKGIKQDNRLLQDELKMAKSRIDLLEKQLTNSSMMQSPSHTLQNLAHQHPHSHALLNRPNSNLSFHHNDSSDSENENDDDHHKIEIKQTYMRQIQRLKDRVNKLEAANADIDNQLEKRELDIAKLRQLLKNEQLQFEEENETLRADYEARERNLKKDLSKIRQELEESQYNEVQTSAIKLAKNRAYELQEELDLALEKNDQLAHDIRKLRDATRQLTEEVKETSKKLGMSEARVLELEKKNEETYEKQVEAQNRIDELEIRLKEYVAVSKKHEDDLESVYRDLEQAKLEKIAMSERTQQLDRERMELIDQLDSHSAEKDTFLKRIRDIEEKQEEALCARDALATEAQHLHDKRAQLEAELKDSEVDIRELNRRLEILNDQKKALEKQNDDLKISQTKSDQERLSLNSQLRESQWQKDAQQRKIIGLEFQVNRRDKEIERLQHFVQQRNQLQQQQQQQNSPTKLGVGGDSVIDQKTDRYNKAITMELEKLREENLQVSKQQAELEQRNSTLQNELKRIDSELENELRQKAKLSTEILQIDKLKKQLREKEDNYERQLNEHTRYIDRMKGNLQRAEARKESCEEKVMVMEQERLRLIRNYEEAQILLKDRGVELDKLNLKVSTEKT